MKRIFSILIIVAVALLGTAWFIHRTGTGAVNSGDVAVRGQSGGKTSLGPAATASGSQPTQTGTTAAANPTMTPPGAQTQAGGLQPPASDSISRNPPSGMIFSGSGLYQLYRQGDITWRLNTDTGDACILFATDAQWRQWRVYQHGCGAS